MSKKFIFIVGLSLLLTACGTTESGADKQGSKEVSETEKSGQESETFYADAAQSMIPVITEEMLEMTDTSYTFISENIKIFPAKTEEDITDAKDRTNSEITSKNLNKSVSPYFEEVLTFEGLVVSVEEEDLGEGEVGSITHVLDDEGYSYEVLMFKTTGDILEDDRVRFWGVPVGGYSFNNISGGATNTQLFVGSHIEKTQ